MTWSYWKSHIIEFKNLDLQHVIVQITHLDDKLSSCTCLMSIILANRRGEVILKFWFCLRGFCLTRQNLWRYHRFISVSTLAQCTRSGFIRVENENDSPVGNNSEVAEYDVYFARVGLLVATKQRPRKTKQDFAINVTRYSNCDGAYRT